MAPHVSRAERLKASLIPSPSSESDWIKNVATCVAHRDVLLEAGLRIVLDLGHVEAVRLLNHPETVKRLREELNAELLWDWPLIVRQHVRQALDGDLASTRFVQQELGLTRENGGGGVDLAAQADFAKQLGKAIKDGLNEKRPPKTVDVQAEVK